MNSERLTPAELAALEEVFGAEVENRLPFRSRLKIYADLDERGYLVRAQIEERGRLIRSGYQLTHKGRMAFCGSCE